MVFIQKRIGNIKEYFDLNLWIFKNEIYLIVIDLNIFSQPII